MSAVANACGIEFDSPVPDWRRLSARMLWSWMKSSWFWILWSFIGFVSLIDAGLVYQFLDAMPYMEKNPLCRFLIMLDADGLSVFLRAKAAGTLLVLLILRVIFVRHRKYSLPITGSVAAFQAGLLVYFVV